MPLIVCPDCSKKVSSSAKVCPNCGYPVAQNIGQSTRKLSQRRGLLRYINSPLKIIMFGLMITLIIGGFTNHEPLLFHFSLEYYGCF
jgi:hypothetical protein